MRAIFVRRDGEPVSVTLFIHIDILNESGELLEREIEGNEEGELVSVCCPMLLCRVVRLVPIGQW